MTLNVTPENSQGIADVFNGWVDELPLPKRAMVDKHIDELIKNNETRTQSHGLGEQSRVVLLAVIYIWYLEYMLEGKRVPKYVDEITY